MYAEAKIRLSAYAIWDVEIRSWELGRLEQKSRNAVILARSSASRPSVNAPQVEFTTRLSWLCVGVTS